ncbi:hypothetical protein Bca52824_022884 [Brassica carinata]|uniref:Uncharacterized protein n=1 Tax=Brassica carinata TaxID=52824 RepID=A0A8X7VHJ1_BRACI|nr:hypothetical protein Bca52824_022884 [Brassica carinata]
MFSATLGIARFQPLGPISHRGGNDNDGDDKPDDKKDLAKVETGGSSQQTTLDAGTVPNGKAKDAVSGSSNRRLYVSSWKARKIISIKGILPPPPPPQKSFFETKAKSRV